MAIESKALQDIALTDGVMTTENVENITGSDLKVSDISTATIAAAITQVNDALDSMISDVTDLLDNAPLNKQSGTFKSTIDGETIKLAINRDNSAATSNYASGIIGSAFSTAIFTDNPYCTDIILNLSCYTGDGNAYVTFQKENNEFYNYYLPKGYNYTFIGRSDGLFITDMFGIDRVITCFVKQWSECSEFSKYVGALDKWRASTSHRALVWYPSANRPQIMTFGLMRDLYKMGYTIRIKETVDDAVRYAAFWTGANNAVPTNTYWYLSNLVETDTSALKGNGGAGTGFAWFAPIGGDTSWATTARNYRINFRVSASTKDSSYAFINVQYQYCTQAIANFAYSGDSDDSGI